MAKFKAYDYRQRVFLPVSLEDQLIPGTLEFAIHTLVENRLDTSYFEERYRNEETGRTAYDPKILLKIVLLGYASATKLFQLVAAIGNGSINRLKAAFTPLSVSLAARYRIFRYSL